jgi:hypothetical protein
MRTNVVVALLQTNWIAMRNLICSIWEYKQEPLDVKTDGLHINPLEFLAAIIYLWLVLKLVMQLPSLLTGYIVNLLVLHNTSALLWMHLRAQTCYPCLQPPAHFMPAMLVTASRHITHIQPIHIPGGKNFEADMLSGPKGGQVP